MCIANTEPPVVGQDAATRPRHTTCFITTLAAVRTTGLAVYMYHHPRCTYHHPCCTITCCHPYFTAFVPPPAAACVQYDVSSDADRQLLFKALLHASDIGTAVRMDEMNAAIVIPFAHDTPSSGDILILMGFILDGPFWS